MAAQHLNQLRASSAMKTTGEAIPRLATRGFVGNGSHRQGGPSQTMTDIRTGENFNHLKLTAEKMMQEQAGVKSDLQVLRTKLQKSEDQVRTLESKLQEINNENAMLKVKHKQDMKLWQGLDSKFLSTTTLCDQLAETVKLLDIQVQEAESSKTYLQDKLAERLEVLQQTECRINDLLEKKEVSEDTVKQCAARNRQLQTTIEEMEQTILSDSIKFNTIEVEKDDLQQQLAKVVRMNEENEAILRSNRCQLDDLQNKVLCNVKEATDLQHLNLTLRQINEQRELDMKNLESILATTRKENATLQQDLEMFKLQITNLENLNASATTNIDSLLAEKAKFMQEYDEDKIAQAKVVHELKQYLIEHKLDVDAIRHQLQEARKENERLVDVIGNEELKFASLQDEMKRLSQEHTEKSQLISRMSQNEANLRRETGLMQEQLTAAENASKSLEIKFNLQLQCKQKESIRHLEDVSQRYNQEIADMRRKSEKEIEETLAKEMADMRRKSETEIEEAIAKERLKGQDALEAAKTASDESMAKVLKAFDQRWQRLHDDCERRIRELREGDEKEKMEILSIHAEESKKHHEELQRENETIKKLLEEEQEKIKIVSVQYDEVRKMEEELQNVKETMKKLREDHEQDTKRIISFHAEEIHKKEVELEQVLKEGILEIREDYEQEKTKAASFPDAICELQEKLRSEKEKTKKLLEQEKTNTISIRSDEVRKMEGELQFMKATMKKLREDHEQDTKRIISFHAEEIHKKEVELEQILKERISELREDYEQEKTKAASFADAICELQEKLRSEKEKTKKLLEEEQEKTKTVSIHSDEVRKMEAELQFMKATMKKLREDHEQDTKRIVSTHAGEIYKKEGELEQIMKERMSKLREDYEQEKTKIARFHADKISAMQEELRTEKEMCHGNIAELQRNVEEFRKSNQEEQERFHQEYQAQLDKWRSKALGLEIQLKESVQQIAPAKGPKEATHLQVLLQDSKMTITEDLVCKDPTQVVTPMTKDKMPQQPRTKVAGRNIVYLTDTTDDDAEEKSQKPALQGNKCHIQQNPRPGKRKMDVVSPPGKAPRKHGRMSRKKGSLGIQDQQLVQQNQLSTESAKATEVCSSGNKKASLTTRDDEPQQQQLINRHRWVDEARRKTGVTCSQQSDLHSMPGPTRQTETRHEVLGLPLEQKKTAPKGSVRKSTKDVAQEARSPPLQPRRIELIKTPSRAQSPAISDLFEIDGLVPYYKGDDPYAFN